jgi:hypothetical protein
MVNVPARLGVARTAVIAVTGLMLCCAALPAGATTPQPCVGAQPVPISHIVVIVMENKALTSVIGSPSAPYLSRLAGGCGLAGSYHGVTHPSLPNYLAMTGGSTFGVTDDKSPAYHRINAPSIFGQLGANWRSYQESMGSNCQKASNGTLYAVKHNPAAYYTTLTTCARNDVPLPANPSFDAALTFVTPNLQHDMHDGSVAQGDSWAAGFIPKVLSSPQYQGGFLALFIVWDENDGPNHVAGNQVPCIVVARSVPPGTRPNTSYDHYSLLATWQGLLGLPRLGQAAAAQSMAYAFRI